VRNGAKLIANGAIEVSKDRYQISDIRYQETMGFAVPFMERVGFSSTEDFLRESGSDGRRDPNRNKTLGSDGACKRGVRISDIRYLISTRKRRP
jgi:hypothetical protein